jgi:hypothetical protein
MKTLILRIAFVLLAILSSTAIATPILSLSPTPLTATTDTVLTIRSGWRELIQIFPSDGGGYNANIVIDGNIINLDVVGGDGIFFFPDVFTHAVNLGQLQAGAYQLKLRFRDTPLQIGVPGQLNPRVRGTANFIVEPSPVLVTQVPGLTSAASILLSLLALSLGMISMRRR